jgi:hypothetical protein
MKQDLVNFENSIDYAFQCISSFWDSNYNWLFDHVSVLLTITFQLRHLTNIIIILVTFARILS